MIGSAPFWHVRLVLLHGHDGALGPGDEPEVDPQRDAGLLELRQHVTESDIGLQGFRKRVRDARENGDGGGILLHAPVNPADGLLHFPTRYHRGERP